MIRALIFDCFGVLYRDSLAMLYDVVPTKRYQELQDATHASDHGYISRQEYFDLVADISGKTSDEVRKIDSTQFVRNEQLVKRVSELKDQYKIGLLSNIGDETMDRLFPQPERDELFDVFVLSSQVGLIKPSSKIFELTAEKFGITPDECIMIDDIPANIDGARAVGMQGILFTTNRQLELDLGRILEVQSA